MLGQRRLEFTSRRVPDFDGPVSAAAGDLLAVWTETNAKDEAVVPVPRAVKSVCHGIRLLGISFLGRSSRWLLGISLLGRSGRRFRLLARCRVQGSGFRVQGLGFTAVVPSGSVLLEGAAGAAGLWQGARVASRLHRVRRRFGIHMPTCR